MKTKYNKAAILIEIQESFRAARNVFERSGRVMNMDAIKRRYRELGEA